MKERAQQYPSLYIGWKLQPADLDDFFNNKNILLHCLNMAKYKNLEQNQTFSNVYLNRKTNQSRNGAVWMSYNQPDRSIVWGKIVIVRKTVWGIKENNPIYRNFTKVLKVDENKTKPFKLIADPLHELSKKLTKVLVITQLETVLSNLKTQLQHLALLTKKSQITESSCMQWNNPNLNIGDWQLSE